MFLKKSSARVVIIGGGIQGISLAYHLAKRNLTDVIVIEMNTLGSGSSGRSAAVIGHVFQEEKTLPLTRLSYEALMCFQDEFEMPCGFKPIGCLLLANTKKAALLQQRQILLQKNGIESFIVSRKTIESLTPGLALKDIELGLHTPKDGEIDPHSIMMAYTRYARQRGVTFLEGVRAVELEIRKGETAGVHTTAGLISAPCVVNAAGFRAREVASWAGMNLPITNMKRHILVTGPLSTYSRTIPFTYEIDVEWYMRREGPGLLIGMGATESDEEDPQVDPEVLDFMVQHSVCRAPALAEAGLMTSWAGLMTSWAGLRPVTPDGKPILGEARHVRGFINDCGWGGHGVMHAPAGGRILAELIIDRNTNSADIAPFSASRFVQ